MKADIEGIRTKLEERLAELRAEQALGRDGRKTVELDQTSVGRLSRMDAMQGQAMANAVEARRQAEVRRIAAALRRIDEDEYGFCVKCGNAIAEARLAIDLTVTTCIACASTR